jgi:antimicrobial peptide system SdpA family protein
MDKKAAALCLCFFASILAYTCLFMTILTNYAGNNPMNKLNSNISNYVSVFPQGWAFFTRSVRERSMALYSVNGSSLSRVELRGFEPEYYFGLSRKNRILTIELSNILYKIDRLPGKRPLNKDILLGDDLSNYVSADTLFYNKIQRDAKTLVLKGKYVLVLQDYLPWSLVRNRDRAHLYQHMTLLPFEL